MDRVTDTNLREHYSACKECLTAFRYGFREALMVVVEVKMPSVEYVLQTNVDNEAGSNQGLALEDMQLYLSIHA